ncbi:protein wings apart-like isoform X2 [Halyomorpha halys]|uniref:protein wings apart-like isoform X2 n=1 Tax=Halyomorpha halys TaxID=286706 RepID=UPI0006D4ECF8|nr:protein wings apart-like isoform X2 [Halyomorpha halys]
MSRGCYKTYGRKVGPTTHASIQFDKLFYENSNKPCAAKSAGTVGKWGITSFTSIRSTNFTVGSTSPTSVKPKKFFKSRVDDDKPKATPPAPAPPPQSLTKQYSRPARPARLASIVAAKKLVDTLENEEYEDDIFQTEAMNLSATPAAVPSPSPPRKQPSPTPTAAPSSPPASHPPIVLRIFKGTAQLLTPTEDDVPHKRDSRRRSYGSDSNGSTTPPKKHKSKYKEYERRDSEKERDISKEEDMQTCLEEGNNLLAETNVDFDATTERLLGVKVVEEDPLKIRIHHVAMDESTTVPEIEPNPPTSDQLDVKEDIEKENELKAPEQIEEPTSPEVIEMASCEEASSEVVSKVEAKPEEFNSDSESGGGGEEKSLPPLPPSQEVIQRVEPLVLRRPPGRPKKGSIFKSRGASGEKRNAHYIHKWCDLKEEGSKLESKPAGLQTPLATDFDAETLTRVTNYSLKEETALEEECEAITSVTCSKKAKEFYTVVRNVKKAHQIQESGEFQEFNDDVEYILDALQDNNPISTRCLSAITLASKCMVPAFRMHVRAHGTVTKFFRALHDATKDQRLGMCTATVMFVLSQDRLNMDIDRDSLELMLSLLESDASHSSALEGCGLSTAELKKTKDRVRSLCQEIQEQGHAKHLNLDNITVGQLAMETLLSLTSKRAGEWFKEELRDLGGLEHIIKTIVETCRPIDHTITMWSPSLLDRLRKADRCLRVLENVTLQNEENNNYLLTYGDGILVDTVVRMLRLCDSQIPFYPTTTLADKESVGAVIRECLVANLKVLINLTHDFNNKSFGSTLAGMREGLIESSLHILLQVPRYIPEEQKFDINVLTLILLINLVEHCEANRKLLIEAKAPANPDSMFEVNSGSALSALVGLFLEQEELARTVERKTDAILDGESKPENQAPKSSEEFIEETVALLLQKAGRHMEHTLIGAYIALLLGYLIVDNQLFEEYVRSHMPNKNYEMLLSVLQKFYNFMMLTSAAGSGSSRGIKATQQLIKQLTDIDKAINLSTNSAADQCTL